MTALSLYALDIASVASAVRPRKQGEGCPGQRPGWRVDPIHAERGQDARRLRTFIVAGPACRAAHSDHTASRNPVTDTYTGVSLRTLLNQAGVIPDPNIKNLHAPSSRATRRADAISPTWSHLRFHRDARSGACDPGVADCATAPPGVFCEPPAHVRERASARPAPIRRPRIKAGPEVLCSRPFRRPLPGKADRVNVRA
jgi:hypothetical protein